MKVSSVREFTEDTEAVLRSKEPVLVIRRGRVTGIFLPQPDQTLPIESKKEVFAILSREVARQVAKSGMSEEEILADFSRWRKKRREAGRGR